MKIKIKRFIRFLFILLLISCNKLFAQRTVPANYSGAAPVNYVRTWDVLIPETNAANLLITTPVDKARITTQYIDGLGRPIQTVIKHGSMITDSTAKDMVDATEYDEFGRESFKYLPFPSTASDGLFKLNPFAQQATFYNNTNPNNPIKDQGETYFYSQVNYEASPLNRVQESFASGNSWVGTSANSTESNRKSVKAKYYINTAIDAVRIWNVTNGAIGILGTYASPGAYPAGQLYKNITVDENNKQVIEFKDKEGKILLKKVQLTATADEGPGKDHTGWLCTYYIYDDLGNLRCVIQPRGVELIASSWVLTNSIILAEQCFRYEYDQRNRMIVKKVPGAGEVNMVYDKRDRLVMMQDANMNEPPAKWMVTKYDALNRPIESGLWTNPTTVATHRTDAANLAGELYEYPNTTGTYEILTKTHYDNYVGVPSPLTSTLNISYINSTNFITTYNASPDYAQKNDVKSEQVTGMVTWSQAKVLGTASQFLTQVNFYDEKGRLIQIQSTNITGGKDIATTQYDFSGKVLRTHLYHEKALAPAQNYQLATRYKYDIVGRHTITEKNINNTGLKKISDITYDALGQMETKKLAPDYYNGTGLQTLDYDYNIRGWLLGMNRIYLATEGQTSDGIKFGFEMGYDKLTNKAGRNFSGIGEFNGNIGGMVWKSDGDDTRRKYDFRYDPVNRLLKADFEQHNSDNHLWNNSQVNYNVKMGDGNNATSAYDANGNIKRMQQWGLKLGSSGQVDDLTYNYMHTNTSNKLLNVADAYNDNQTKLGDFRVSALNPVLTKTTTTEDYTYDANGNMVKDLNKDIIASGGANGIQYNYLNLPSIITVKNATGTKGTITYTYDAAGNKQKKVTVENASAANNNITTTTTTTYIGGMVYESKTDNNPQTTDYTDVLQFVPHEEGRIRYKPAEGAIPASFAYDYFIKDHLGNVRMVLTEEQQTIFYPAATLEGTYDAATNSMVNFEKGYYKIDNSKIVTETSIPSWGTETTANTKLYYNHNGNPPTNLSYRPGCAPTQTAGSSKLYKLNATSNKTGLEFMIKVMAGDKVDIFGKSYYLNTAPVTNGNSTALDLLGLMTNILLSPENAALGKGLTAQQLQTINNGLVPASFFRGNNSEPATTIPKAFINYILLDEQFKFAGGSASRVGANGTVKNHWNDAQLQNITVPKNGYIFVYVSNESNLDVFFDNLQVIHKPGPILEETHYYPFGLTMAGISSKASGMVENKKKYNGIEFENDLELNVYDAQFRELDAQTGRWWQIDPKTEEMYMWSTYASNFDNPIRYQDPLGDEPNGNCCGEWLGKVWSGIKERVSEYTSKEGLMSLAFPVASLSKSLVEDPKGTVNSLGETLYNGSVVGTVNNAINNPKELGKTLVDGAVVVAAEKLPGAVSGVKNTITGNVKSGLGDLTKAEVKGIQKVVNEAERPIEVVGSGAQGTRRGVGTNNPIGKGPGTRSDIDYVAPSSSIPYYNQNNLPGIDPRTGVIPGYANPFQSKIIRFEPNAKPTVTPKQ